MPNYDDLFGSNFLKAEDLAGREVAVKIAKVESVEMGGKNKAVMTFDGKKKSLVLNKTNASKIAAAYGQNFNDWTGKEIVLYPDETPFNGQMVPCLRVRVPQAAKNAPGDDAGPIDW